MGDEALWAAFKTFDIDDSNRISKLEFQKVLESVDVKSAWSEELCGQLTSKILEKFDCDGDERLSFEEWTSFMRECWHGHQLQDLEVGKQQDDVSIADSLKSTRVGYYFAYGFLTGNSHFAG